MPTEKLGVWSAEVRGGAHTAQNNPNTSKMNYCPPKKQIQSVKARWFKRLSRINVAATPVAAAAAAAWSASRARTCKKTDGEADKNTSTEAVGGMGCPPIRIWFCCNWSSDCVHNTLLALHATARSSEALLFPVASGYRTPELSSSSDRPTFACGVLRACHDDIMLRRPIPGRIGRRRAALLPAPLPAMNASLCGRCTPISL